jgi:hypothetical protein
MLDGPFPPLVVVISAIVLAIFRRRFVGSRTSGWPRDFAVMAAIVAIAALLELAMGRPLTYTKGPIRLWSGDIRSDQNSQQIADPYTVTHVVHGALFYGLARIALPSAPPGLRAIAATTVEAAWEAYENTDQVINRYRTETISLGYYGDSVINSVADMLACVAGFFLTRRLPTKATVIWVLAAELILAFWIRDNLTLNILMLIHPVDAIRRWQTGV